MGELFTPTFTKAFLLVWVAVLAVYAVLSIRFGGKEASVSVAVHDFVSANPVVAFFLGVLIGHLLWPVR